MGAKFYSGDDLQDKVPQKIISVLLKGGVLNKDDIVDSILGSTVLWGVNNCIITTDRQIIGFYNTPKIEIKRYSLADISSVTFNAKVLSSRIVLGIADGEQVVLKPIDAIPPEIDKLYNFLAKKVENNKKERYGGGSSANTPISASDEIKKMFELKEEGIITEEEFELKKKQLLGL